MLDEFEHGDMERGGEDSIPKRNQPYTIDFRLPLKGISRTLISPSQLNVCNMFSTLYFLQLVVVTRSDSLKIPGVKKSRSDNGFQVIESQPVMIKFIR